MIFYSVAFLILFGSASILFHLSKNTKQQHLVMLLASCVFYGYWDVRFLCLLVAEIGLCYGLMLAYSKTKRRAFVVGAVIFCLAVLGVFKYCNFFLDTLGVVFGIQNMSTLKLIIPLGISFYTFQALSYVFDVYRGIICAEKDFIKLAAYLTFFPQITSGPIVKARTFLPQLDVFHKITKENIYSGLQLFLLGLTKKLVFADRIGVAVDAVFHAPAAYNGISVLFAVLGYALQIYCDFSGYSDMAIGIARIWGFNLGQNFNLPYLAQNPSDFWGRWHISLSDWFKQYVYIPLGGSRAGKWKTYRNLFITMLLSGIWHGASWTFVIWGVFHAVYAVAHKLWRSLRGQSTKKSHPAVCLIANIPVICLSWVIFRADRMHTAFSVLRGLFNTAGICYVNVYTVVYLAIAILVHVYAYKKNNGNAPQIALNLDLFKNKLLLAVWICLIAMFAYAGDSAFIYAQF